MSHDYCELMQTALRERDNAYRNLNFAEGEYIDVAIYQINMAESRVFALMEEAKRMGVTAC